MKFERIYSKKRELYDSYLNSIKDINFTHREIDIIACVLHSRGEKKIASLLSISPRTVSAHIHNVMLKLGYNSREHLIDFIEKSGKLLFIKQYYLELVIQDAFEKQLMKIGKIIRESPITCSINYTKVSIEEKKILNQVKGDLKLASINLKDHNEIIGGVKDNFYLLTDDLIDNQDKTKYVFLMFRENNNYLKNIKSEYLDFTKKEEYYFTLFSLLRKIIKESYLEGIIEEFTKEYNSINDYLVEKPRGNENTENITLPFARRKLTNRNLIILLALIVLMFGVIILGFSIHYNKTALKNVSTDIPWINELMLLKRKYMLGKIEKRLRSQDNIKTVALVGVGGAGKTTLARQYARNQKAQLTWEINCETNDNMISSFQNLAHSLCGTEEDRQRLAIILQNTNQVERQKNLSVFLTSKIKSYPNWVLVYDNVETFKDIQQYFPYNHDVWGNGTVIITTRDGNMANNSYILGENVIKMEELDEEEKLELFKKIIGNSNYTNIDDQKITLTDFLKKIPPFPLDISIAAHYIKEMKISYDQYLQYIIQSQEAFTSNQKTLLNDIGEYNKTRHEIIVFSLKHIIKINPDFADLLLFISVIDPEDIPKEILVKYKDEIIVSKFIHELKRFSLIHEKPSSKNGSALTLSIHRNTQSTTLSYLTKELQLTPDSRQFEEIANSLAYYPMNLLQPNYISIASQAVPHIEMFLNHHNLFNEKVFNNLSEELGIYYSRTADYQRARPLLEKALIVNKKIYGREDIKTAEVGAYLAVLYKNIGDYQKGVILLENALETYQRFYGKDHNRSISCMTFLGNLYKDIGAYSKAKELLEYCLAINKKERGLKNINTARVIGYLGSIYNDIGEYSKAKALLEESYNVYNNNYGHDNVLVSGSFIRLANLYNNIGEYTKARKLSEEALIMYKKNYGENHIDTALSLFSLGNALVALEIYQDGLKSLEQVITIYKKNYGEDHINTALVLNSLGAAHLLMNDLATAQTLLNQALTIFQKNEHPNSFISLEKLSELCIKRSIEENNKGNIQEMYNLKKQAIIYLEQALKVVQTCLPEDSPHIARIKLKIKDITI